MYTWYIIHAGTWCHSNFPLFGLPGFLLPAVWIAKYLERGQTFYLDVAGGSVIGYIPGYSLGGTGYLLGYDQDRHVWYEYLATVLL